MANILLKVVRICNSNSNAIIWKTKPFSQIFVPFLESTSNFEYFENNMIVIANVLPNLETVKVLLKPVSKKRRFRIPFDSQHVKASQMPAKSPWESFYEVFLSFSVRLIWKMSPLVLSEILGVFVETLTADGKDPVQGCENLQLPIQMQLSPKQKSFLNFLFHFWNLHQIFNTFKKRWLS